MKTNFALVEKFVENKDFRDQYINKTDVLNRVKLLSLLPDDTYMTTKMAAEYYEVGKITIDLLLNRHKNEFSEDGLLFLSGDELKSYKSTHLQAVSELKRVPKLTLLTRRAILRIGMLLRDSEVAKKIRTYLLNAEEQATKDQKKKATQFTGSWSSKDELILLDCVYSVVGNGGTLKEAFDKATELFDHSFKACEQHYYRVTKNMVTDSKIKEAITNNKSRAKLSIVHSKETKSDETNKVEVKLNQLLELQNEISNILDKTIENEKLKDITNELNLKAVTLEYEIKIKDVMLEDKDKVIQTLNDKIENYKALTEENRKYRKECLALRKKLSSIEKLLSLSRKSDQSPTIRKGGKGFTLVNGVPIIQN